MALCTFTLLCNFHHHPSRLSNVLLYIMYHTFFIHSSINRHLGYVHVLAIVNSVAMNIGVHVSFQTMLFCNYVPRSGTTQSYGSCIFSFLRNLCTVLDSGCISFHCHQNFRRVLVFPHPLQDLLFVNF